MTVIRHPNNQGVTLSQWRKTAAGGETSVSGTDDFSAGLAYTAGAEQVFVNGVLLERGVDYTASTGTTVTGLTALVAGDIVTVSSPSAFNVANAIPKATITAKGDLLVGAGASTPTNLGVGADGTTLVANSASATGVAWAGPSVAAGKNAIINGDFGVWQRGTSFANPGNGGYTADRFFNGQDGTGTVTCTQQTFTAGTAPVAGYEGTYFLRTSLTTLDTTTYFQPTQRIENVRTFAGQAITVSFWAKADSARTSLVVLVQNFGSGGSAATTQAAAVTYSTAWTRYSFNFTVGSMSGKTIGTGSSLEIGARTTAAVGSILDIWGVQVEAGSVATAFQTATGTVQGELTACQRYYWRVTEPDNGDYVSTTGVAANATIAQIPIQLPVTMRTYPTVFEQANIGYYNLGNLTVYNTGTWTLNNGNQQIAVVRYTHGSSVLTGGQGGAITSTGTGYIAFGAEL